MKIALAILALVGPISMAPGAYANCDLSKFAEHPPPPTALRAPPVQDQYGDFEWGSDAYMNNGLYWWGWNFIKNDSPGISLTANWKKGGITIPTANPLPAGAVFCRKRLLGDHALPIPTLDQDAPIVYSVNNQVQEAAVFSAANPGKLALSPNDKDATTYDEIQSVFKDSDEKLIFVDVGIGSHCEVKGCDLYVHIEPHNLSIGISNIFNYLNSDQIGPIVRQFRSQHFAVRRARLDDMDTRSEIINGLFLSPESAADEFLFLAGGVKAQVFYSSDPNAVKGYQRAALVILTETGHPIAGTEIQLTLPAASGTRP